MRLLVYICVLVLSPSLARGALQKDERDSLRAIRLRDVSLEAERKQEPGTEKIGQKQLSVEMTSDIRDLIRYIPGVGISYSGQRSGSRGFAIRGVEANRVAIGIDGVPQPEIHENIVFSAYGLTNASRIEFDPYFVSSIDIRKGAASFVSGGGALGGSVNYNTKRSEDLIRSGNRFGGVAQLAWNGKDNLRMALGGGAFRTGRFEGLVMMALRRGNQIRNFEYGELTRNVTSTRVDPMKYDQQTLLGKLAFVPNARHRVEFGYYMLNKTIESEIWSQEPLDIFTSDGRPYYYSHDQALNHSFTLNYLFTPVSGWLERLSVKANLQSTWLDARTWSEYYRPNFTGGGSYELIYGGRRDKYRGLGMRDKLADVTLDFRALDLGIAGAHSFTLYAACANRFNDNRNVDVEKPYASDKKQGYTVRMGVRYEFGESMGKFINAYSYQRPVSRDNYSASVMDRIRLTDRLNVVLGVRQDVFRTRDREWSYANDRLYMDYLTQNLKEVSPGDERISDSDAGTSFIATAGYEFHRYLTLGYKFSTGFRMPTTEERYFRFYSSWPSFVVLSNRGLRPETSSNHEIEISGTGALITYVLSVYRSGYRDFIDIEQGTLEITNPLDDTRKKISYARNVNRTSADLRGIDVKLYLHPGAVWAPLEGFGLSAAASYARGSTSYGTSMLGVQPATGFVGLEYTPRNEKWNLNAKMNAFFAKKRSDTRFVEKTATKEIRRTFPAQFLTDAFTFDVYGSWRVTGAVTVRAGVYNLFNVKYWRWDDLRQLTNPALLPYIENFFREGIATITRFTQPRRYFSMSVELNL